MHKPTIAQLKKDFSERILTNDEIRRLVKADSRNQVVSAHTGEPHGPVMQGSLAEYLRTMHWDAFFTAMAAPKSEDYIVLSDGSRILKQHYWRSSSQAIDSVQRALSSPRLRPVKIFIVAEQYRIAGWHCHGLLEFPDTRHYDSMVGFQKANLKPLGFNKVSLVGCLDACSAYLSKYLTKDEFHGDWRMVGRKKFWLPREVA